MEVNQVFILMLPLFCMALLLYGNVEIFQKKRDLEAAYLIFPILIFGLVYIGNRPLDAGGDTIPYLMAYDEISSFFGATHEALYGKEALFWPAQVVLKFFFDERGWLISNYLVIVLLSYFSYCFATKNTGFSPLLFSIVFMTYFGVYVGNALRQVYAVPLVVMAFYCLFNRFNYRYLALSILAIGFHWSAVVVFTGYFFSRIANRQFIYVAVPLLAFAGSYAVETLAVFIVDFIPLSWLVEKINLYFFGGRVSHIGDVRETANFWLCVAVYGAMIFGRVFAMPGGDALMKYMMMILSAILFFIDNSDVSERYMVYFLFLIPLSCVYLLRGVAVPVFLKNGAFVFSFFILGFFVYNQPSAKLTLGIS